MEMYLGNKNISFGNGKKLGLKYVLINQNQYSQKSINSKSRCIFLLIKLYFD